MLVLRTSNFQGATIRPIVPRHKHYIVFIVHHQMFFPAGQFKDHIELFLTVLDKSRDPKM